MVGLGLGIGIFVVVWVFIIYDIKNAPLVDENYNVIEKEDKDEV